MKLRPVLSVLAGYVTLLVAFWIPAFLLASMWPAMREAARLTMEQGRYDVYDTSMLVAFQFVWAFANAAAGFVTRRIARRQGELWCLAVLLFAYYAYNHWWRLWNVMPDWYNLLLVVLVVPTVLIGGVLARRGARTGTA